MSAGSHNSEELHPNFQIRDRKRVYTGCAKYLHRFDELIMRPLFIYKYEKKMVKKSEEFFDVFAKQGQVIEENFQKSAKSATKASQSSKLDQINETNETPYLEDGQGSQGGMSSQHRSQNSMTRSFMARGKLKRKRKNMT